MLRLFASALVALALVTGAALAAGGGPSPGLMTGWDGAATPSRSVRYVAMPVGTSTIVAAVRTSDGRMLRYSTIHGGFGVPIVAYDGTTEGVSHDGTTLVLAECGASQQQTRFAVLRTSRLRLRAARDPARPLVLDALSRDGRMLYAIQYLGTGPNPRYQRPRGQPRHGEAGRRPLVDKREPDEEMNGHRGHACAARTAPGRTRSTRSRTAPASSTRSTRPGGGRSASICPGGRARSASPPCVCRSPNGGRTLELEKPVGTRLAVVDTTTFKVTAFAKP